MHLKFSSTVKAAVTRQWPQITTVLVTTSRVAVGHWLALLTVNRASTSLTHESTLLALLIFFAQLFSQGFFNAVIFTLFKCGNLRNAQPRLSLLDTFVKVICRPAEVPYIVIEGISLISMVGDNNSNIKYSSSAPAPNQRRQQLVVPEDIEIESLRSCSLETPFEPSLALSDLPPPNYANDDSSAEDLNNKGSFSCHQEASC